MGHLPLSVPRFPRMTYDGRGKGDDPQVLPILKLHSTEKVLRSGKEATRKRLMVLPAPIL